MVDLQVITLKGQNAVLDESKVAGFQAALRGPLIQPGDDSYDEQRQVWNANIDKRPALIARCAGVADVINSVNFARENNLLVSVRGGGHNVSGNAVCDGGIMIDLSQMKGARVDPENRTAHAEPGLTWAEFDGETQAFGLATPGGQVSTTGIAGVTLGGGWGWLARKYGMACRQPFICGYRHRRRQVPHRQRHPEPGPLLGPAGGRRQLWRGYVLRILAPSCWTNGPGRYVDLSL